MASGIVWVRPGKLPANMMVAPNSPSARRGQHHRQLDERVEPALARELVTRQQVGERSAEREHDGEGRGGRLETQPDRLEQERVVRGGSQLSWRKRIPEDRRERSDE